MEVIIKEEKLVSFKVAKLANEMGFCWSIKFYQPLFIINEDGSEEINSLEGKQILRPTQTMLEDWLRDTFNININIKHKPFNQKYGYNISGSYHEGENGVLKTYDFKTFEKHEDALEDALEEVLKELILKKEENNKSVI